VSLLVLAAGLFFGGQAIGNRTLPWIALAVALVALVLGAYARMRRLG
jgi:hypothetical protein